MFVLSFICSGSELWSVSHTSIHGNSKSSFFNHIKVLGEISNNWVIDLLATNVYKTLEPCWKSLFTILQCTKIVSVISK